MPPKHSNALVIDADVARSAGEKEEGVSKFCREFLIQMREMWHRLIMTEPIHKEWKHHRSGFALTWWRTMAQKGQIVYLTPAERSDLIRKIKLHVISTKMCDAFEKDLHLLEAALAGDHIIVSRDATTLDVLKMASPHIGELGTLVWQDPTICPEKVIEWLKTGDLNDKRWHIRSLTE